MAAVSGPVSDGLILYSSISQKSDVLFALGQCSCPDLPDPPHSFCTFYPFLGTQLNSPPPEVSSNHASTLCLASLFRGLTEGLFQVRSPNPPAMPSEQDGPGLICLRALYLLFLRANATGVVGCLTQGQGKPSVNVGDTVPPPPALGCFLQLCP